MSDRYAASGAQTVTATPGDTVLTLIGLSLTRGKLYDLVFGTIGTPADAFIQWLLRRFTAAGTGTGVGEIPLDTDAPANQLTADENHTVEPTYAADSELLDFGVNVRASFRWVAAPGGELVVPATAANGIGLTPIAAGYSADVAATYHWEE
ncbi:hypothetical protein LCGC14_2014870 [marine sediment metagenome]|uniref:Uncharacterized protein n=1 Tax=marine sediment metagenome TaxID=412755 RepID=A0A0F9EZ92_9ZZZZ